MFCPKCSQPQTADNLRFCPRCGFRLDAVKELVEREGADPSGVAPDESTRIRQKDISLGAGLMFVGGIVAALWGLLEPHWPPDMVLPKAFFIVGGTLAFVLTLFHPLVGALRKHFSDAAAPPAQSSKRRDGINLGALLMFVGILKAFVIASYAEPKGRATIAIFVMLGVFVLVLLLRPLVRTFYRLFFNDSDRADEAAAPPSEAPALNWRGTDPPREAALPPAQTIPVNGFTPPRVNTAEMAPPPSVTEDTTRKL